MDISIQNWIVDKFNDARQIKLLAEAGFKYIDWDMDRYYLDSKYVTESAEDCRNYFEKLRSVADKAGVTINQTHSLFPTYMTHKNELTIFAGMENCFLATSILGAKYTVVHPMMPRKWEGEEHRDMRISENIKFYNSIAPLAKKYNVIICIENMFGAIKGVGKFKETSCSRYEDMLEILDGVEDKSVFAFCYDSGHANLIYHDNMADEIKALGQNIKIVHLHDNNGMMDFHSIPNNGNIDWNKVMSALREVGFDGKYNFEIAPFVNLHSWNAVKKLKELREKLETFVSKYSD